MVSGSKTALCERTRSPVRSIGTPVAYSSPRIAVSPFPRREGPRAHALGTSTRGGCAVSSPTSPNGTGNRLLDRLPRKASKSLLPQLETSSLAHEEEVCHQNSPLSHVYFPTNGVFSTVILIENGARIEATTIAKDGMVG